MKLHHKNIEKDSYGSITMTPEEPEDMWHVYNLIAVGDKIRASTIRKVTTESTTGSTTSNRVRTILTIRIEDIDFDNQACKVIKSKYFLPFYVKVTDNFYVPMYLL